MLFAQSQLVGTFKGFVDKGLEFAAEIVSPYESSMLERPQLGQFLLIELGSEEEASLGRITKFVPTGILASAEGEDYVNTMQRRQQSVPEDLKQQRLKYRVQVKLLGAVRVSGNGIAYVPSQRRLPHLGARVAMPSAQVLRALCQLSGGETDLGDFVLGEFVFCGAGVHQPNVALRSMDPHLEVSFNINNLVSRRTVVFARAGYGKSNLMKYLVSELYKAKPQAPGGLPVGTLVFDPDGEYFWPDKVVGRPGFCDVPHLSDRLAVFTNRVAPNPYYASWKLGSVKLDIRDLPARDVIGIAISPERQEQQNVNKLKSLRETEWRDLVDLFQRDGLRASDAEIGKLLGYQGAQIANAGMEINAARSNMAGVVRLLHDPNSKLLSGSLKALQDGSIVVVDLSQLSSSAGNMLAGLLMRRIFSHNQDNFTGGVPLIPTIVVLEEAQSILGRNLSETSPFVEWVKEGRKYNLGAILITQQPGSMAPEILSQADNWFCFHLLSEGDAGTLGKYNAHFSDDVLAHLISEPIEGNCFMWSAPKQPFVLPVRIRSFEHLYKANIKVDPGTERVPGTLAEKIDKSLANEVDVLAAALVEKLKTDRSIKFQRLATGTPNDPLYGLYTKQLFFVMQALATGVVTLPLNHLSTVLLSKILGEGQLREVTEAQPSKSDPNKKEDRTYLAAAKSIWVTAGLGNRVQD